MDQDTAKHPGRPACGRVRVRGRSGPADAEGVEIGRSRAGALRGRYDPRATAAHGLRPTGDGTGELPDGTGSHGGRVRRSQRTLLPRPRTPPTATGSPATPRPHGHICGCAGTGAGARASTGARVRACGHALGRDRAKDRRIDARGRSRAHPGHRRCPDRRRRPVHPTRRQGLGRHGRLWSPCRRGQSGRCWRRRHRGHRGCGMREQPAAGEEQRRHGARDGGASAVEGGAGRHGRDAMTAARRPCRPGRCPEPLPRPVRRYRVAMENRTTGRTKPAGGHGDPA